MARKRTPKAKPAAAENDFGGMAFPDIGNPEPAEGETKSTPENDLQKQLDEMRSNYTKLQEDLARVTTVQAAIVPPTPPKAMTYDGLPDPVNDPAAYAMALGQRIRDEANSQRQYDQQNQSIINEREQKIEGLWEDFEGAYPEIAKDKEGMEFVTMKVAKKAKARGADLDRYMFVTQQKFMQDVAQEYGRIFGEDDGESEPAPKPRRRAREDDEPTRTSVFGGLEGGGRPSNPEPKHNEQGMVKELQDLQLQSGFFGNVPRKA